MNSVFHIIVGITMWKKNPMRVFKVLVIYSDLLVFFTRLAQNYTIRPCKEKIEKQIISLAP